MCFPSRISIAAKICKFKCCCHLFKLRLLRSRLSMCSGVRGASNPDVVGYLKLRAACVCDRHTGQTLMNTYSRVFSNVHTLMFTQRRNSLCDTVKPKCYFWLLLPSRYYSSVRLSQEILQPPEAQWLLDALLFSSGLQLISLAVSHRNNFIDSKNIFIYTFRNFSSASIYQPRRAHIFEAALE